MGINKAVTIKFSAWSSEHCGGTGDAHRLLLRPRLTGTYQVQDVPAGGLDSAHWLTAPWCHWPLQVQGTGLLSPCLTSRVGSQVVCLASSRGMRSHQAVTLALRFNPSTSSPSPISDVHLLCYGPFSTALTHGQLDLPVPMQVKQTYSQLFPVLKNYHDMSRKEACLWPHAYFATGV